MANTENIFDRPEFNKSSVEEVNIFKDLDKPPVPVEPKIQQMDPMDLADLEAGGVDPITMDSRTDNFDADDMSLSIPEEDLPYKEQLRIKNAERKIAQEKQAIAFGKQLPKDMDALGEHLWENKFSYTLGALGTVIGPWGTIAASTLGTGIDTALKTSDETGEIDQGEVGLDMAVSFVLDTAMLKTLKLVPQVRNAIKEGLRKGIDPNEIIKALRKDEAKNFGTQASTKQTQEMVSTNTYNSLNMEQASGETLSSFQSLYGTLSDAGFLSKKVLDANNRSIIDVARQGINKLVGTNLDQISTLQLGKHQATILNIGKAILTDNHGKVLKQLTKTKNMNNFVSSKPISNAIFKWEKENALDAKGLSKLTPQAQKVFTSLKNEYQLTDATGKRAKFPARHYLEVSEKINKQINQFKTFGSGSFDPQAARELTSLSKTLKDVAYKELKQINPETAVRFRVANTSYGTSMNQMFPEMTKEYIQATGKKGYQQVAEIFDTIDSPEKILAMRKAITKAYSVMTPKNKARLESKTPEEFFSNVKQRYVEKRLTTLQDRTIDPQEITKEARNLNSEDVKRGVGAILGKDFKVYKKLVNVMAEVSQNTSGGLGGLALSGKQTGALFRVGETAGIVGGGLVSGIGFSALASLPGTIIAATGILYAPKMMAKYVTNPKRVNKLLGIHGALVKNNYKPSALINEKMYALYNDVYKEFDDEEKKELYNWLKDERKSMTRLGSNN